MVELKNSDVSGATVDARMLAEVGADPPPGFFDDFELALARLLFVVPQVGSIVRSGVQAVARPTPTAARRKVRWFEHQLAVDAESQFSETFAVVNRKLRFL